MMAGETAGMVIGLNSSESIGSNWGNHGGHCPRRVDYEPGHERNPNGFSEHDL